MFDAPQFWTRLRDPVIAITTWRASPDERTRALSPLDAHVILQDLIRDGQSATLMALLELATGVRGGRTRPPDRKEWLSQIGAAIDRGALLIVSGSAAAGASGQVAPARAKSPDDRLVESLMGDRPELSFEGSRFRVVSARRWREERRQQSSLSDFRLLLPNEARAVIGRLLAGPKTSADDRPLWANAAERLLDRAGGRADDGGIVLLRYAPPAGGAAPEPAAPPTPPPPRPRPAVAPTDWIEVEIVYEDGTPFEGDCTLELPGGRSVTGPGDSDGVIRVEGITPGPCKLSFPDLDAEAWSQQ